MSASNLRRCLPVFIAALCAVFMTGCGGMNSASARIAGVVTPYKMEVVQGNFVSKEQVAYLKPGLTRQQVREVLGTSLLTSVFHEERWDYVFTIRRQGVEPQSRRLTLFFNGDSLQRFEGDEMPSESEFVASLDSRRKGAKIPQLEATEEQLQKYPAAPAEAQAAIPAAGSAPTSYPPLESPRR